jgi:hypothetical protein
MKAKLIQFLQSKGGCLYANDHEAIDALVLFLTDDDVDDNDEATKKPAKKKAKAKPDAEEP